MHPCRLLGPILFLGIASFAPGCGTDAVGVEACKKIESARCRAAPACGIDLTKSPHEGSDVDGCKRYYDVACLHGLVAGSDPGAPAVQACVDVISSANCAAVAHPESVPACAFLNPQPVPDAGPEAAAVSSDAAPLSDADGG